MRSRPSAGPGTRAAERRACGPPAGQCRIASRSYTRRSGRGARKKAARSSARQPLELRSVADDLAGDWNAEHNLLDPEFDAFDGDVLGQLGVRLFDDAY